MTGMIDQLRELAEAEPFRRFGIRMRGGHSFYITRPEDIAFTSFGAPQIREVRTPRDQCIDCDLCRETAPANFTRSDDGGYSYVFKQPTTPEEEALCKEAMGGCPVEAKVNVGGRIV